MLGYGIAPLAGLTAFWLAEAVYLMVAHAGVGTALYSLIPIVALGIGFLPAPYSIRIYFLKNIILPLHRKTL